jgi:hypothetical protein
MMDHTSAILISQGHPVFHNATHIPEESNLKNPEALASFFALLVLVEHLPHPQGRNPLGLLWG